MLGSRLLALVVPLATVVLWQWLAVSGALSRGLLPSPISCAQALYEWLVHSEPGSLSGSWLEAFSASALRVLLGFVIGGTIGIVLGLGCGISPLTRRMLDPTINVLRPISIVAWVPLAIILFGIGDRPAVFLTSLAAFYPVYVNVFSGARYVDNRLIQAARMLGADRRSILFRVILPATLPSIAVGLRIAGALAWTSVIVAEAIGAKSGLGYVLYYSYSQFHFAYVVAAMASLGACGFATDKLLELAIERRIKWLMKGSAETSRRSSRR